MTTGHKLSWSYNKREFIEDDIKDNVGFVYLIENCITGKKYIGKKLFKFTRTKKVKGKKRKVVKESDWKSYYGSNKKLLEDVQEHGKENFKRKILRLCKTRGTASYYEVKYQNLSSAFNRTAAPNFSDRY